MRHVPGKKYLVADSLSRRLKCEDDSDGSRKDIEEFLDYELKCLEIYYLSVTVYEGRVRMNFGGVKCRGKAFVNTGKGGNSSESSKSPGDDFSVDRDGDYNSIRILNLELEYSERY